MSALDIVPHNPTPLPHASGEAGAMLDSSGLVRRIRAVLPENAVAAITLAIILSSDRSTVHGALAHTASQLRGPSV